MSTETKWHTKKSLWKNSSRAEVGLASEISDFVRKCAAPHIITFEELRENARAKFNNKLYAKSLERWEKIKIRRRRRKFSEKSRRKMVAQREELREDNIKWRREGKQSIDEKLERLRRENILKENKHQELLEATKQQSEKQEELEWILSQTKRYWRREKKEDSLRLKALSKTQSMQDPDDALPPVSEIIKNAQISPEDLFQDMPQLIKTAYSLRNSPVCDADGLPCCHRSRKHQNYHKVASLNNNDYKFESDIEYSGDEYSGDEYSGESSKYSVASSSSELELKNHETLDYTDESLNELTHREYDNMLEQNTESSTISSMGNIRSILRQREKQSNTNHSGTMNFQSQKEDIQVPIYRPLSQRLRAVTAPVGSAAKARLRTTRKKNFSRRSILPLIKHSSSRESISKRSAMHSSKGSSFRAFMSRKDWARLERHHQLALMKSPYYINQVERK